jgi:hypothetical protein
MRNNKAESQAAKEARDKKDKAKSGYDNKSRDDMSYDKVGKSPRGTYSNYTRLTMPLAKVYKEIMYSELKDKPPPLPT